MFKTTGIVKYGPSIRVVAEVDRGIADYYRNLISKSVVIQPQKYKPHVSIVRVWEDTVVNELYGKYEGEVIELSYEPEIQNDNNYYWLNVYSKRIEEIRVELGLKVYPTSHGKYHLTIGNVKC